MSSSLLRRPPLDAETTYKVPKRKGTGSLLEASFSVGLTLLDDPDGPAVVVRLEVPRRVREELLSLANDAVHAGVAKSDLPYPAGGLGVWVVLTTKGPLARYTQRVFPILAANIEASVSDFLRRNPPR